MTERLRTGILNGPDVKWACCSQPVSVPGRERAHTLGSACWGNFWTNEATRPGPGLSLGRTWGPGRGFYFCF